jgi:hypothetical protein
MKFLSELRYILFAVILLGLFANMAQNEYGLDMIYGSEIIIGFIFWIESVYYYRTNKKTNKKLARFLSSEHFWLGMLFFGLSLRYMHFPGAGPSLISAGFFIGMMYVLYFLKVLRIKQDRFVVIKVLNLLFVACTVIALNGYLFKGQHWPYATKMIAIASVLFIAFVILSFINIKFPSANGPVTFFQNLQLMPGKMLMVCIFFSLWCIYYGLTNLNITPPIYSLTTPPAIERLKQQNKDASVDAYWESYDEFISNREDANNEMITVNF